jgi:hypothetical protein
MSTLETIKQAIVAAGATYCKIKINTVLSDFDEEHGDLDIPDYMSISLFIQGGNDLDIARAIYNTKPIGIYVHGDFSLQINGFCVKWYNLNYDDYNQQKIAQNKLSRKLEKEFLLERLAELEEEDE